MGQKHSLTRYTVLTAAAGLALNLALSKLVLYFGLPLYLDSVGTVISAMLGGYLPGIVAGFFSNIINGFSDPITYFYAIISILIAVSAAFLARRSCFSSVWKALLTVLVFSFIGGGLGSMLTWLLYGFSFGSGITAPFALMLFKSGLPEFYAQLTADLLVDLADKLITVLIVYTSIRLMPDAFLEKLPNGHFFLRGDKQLAIIERVDLVHHSLRGKVVLMISLSAFIIGTTATAIGFAIYKNTMTEHYTSIAESVVDMERSTLDADKITRYIRNDAIDIDYIKDELRLKRLRDSVPDIQYVYVYQIKEDGCHVIFDIDTPGTAGGEFGDVVEMEPAFDKYKATLLAGGAIPPVISNGAYGWLLSVYRPLVNSYGNTVAYAAADIAMDTVMSDWTIFIIKMASLLFGVSIIIVSFALWYAERRLVDPINAMAKASSEFAYDSDTQRYASTRAVQELRINTGDEIEKLYGSLNKTVTDVSAYIEDISRKAEIISRLHRNIIISFANMVENRDNNTGHHIRRTAAYVSTITSELYSEGKYPETIDKEFISAVVRCAPLHDLGKIRVPDAILNKPGRLTPEEFEQIKEHTTAGKEIIEGIVKDNSGDADYLSEAAKMAYSHHERWDGSGYPQGLKGEEIPLSARIMAVADVFDALVSKRSYKEAMEPDEAYSVIISGSGSHFDPVVVSAFVNAKGAILAEE